MKLYAPSSRPFSRTHRHKHKHTVGGEVGLQALDGQAALEAALGEIWLLVLLIFVDGGGS